jgi:hypothetical protein
MQPCEFDDVSMQPCEFDDVSMQSCEFDDVSMQSCKFDDVSMQSCGNHFSLSKLTRAMRGLSLQDGGCGCYSYLGSLPWHCYCKSPFVCMYAHV